MRADQRPARRGPRPPRGDAIHDQRDDAGARRAADEASAAVSAAATDAVTSGGQGLARVLRDVPAAVLMVDVETGCVTYANAEALELTDLALPASAGEWVRAAGIETIGGGSGATPLELAARGEPVHGEPLVVPGESARRTVVWATAIPLPPINGLDRASLVVLLPVDPGFDGAEASSDVRNRALVAAGLSFTISDPHAEDNPLVWVNPAFTGMTGYDAEEVLGHNCRFLQGPATRDEHVQVLRDAIADRTTAQVVLLNYRKDGTAFWNEVALSPVFDGTGELTHFVGVQADVTARVDAELQREAHLRAEQEAREQAERIQERLTLLGDATETLVATLDVDEALGRLVDVVVPRLADWCVVDLLGEGGTGAHRVAATHTDPARREALRTVERLQPRGLAEAAPIRQVATRGEPVLLPEVDMEEVAGYSRPDLFEAYAALDTATAIVVPLRARRQVLGTLTLVRGDGAPPYDEEDLELAVDLARRAALIVDNARLYAREHRAAEALQLSLLPELPEVPGLDVAARYLPGAVGAAVGGDWYDVLRLPDGSVGLAVGDVMGHDMAAAAAMGQLRSVLRSFAWQRQTPAQVLDNLDQLVQALDMAQLATAVFGRLDLDDDGGAVFEFANAGHLPPLVALPDGEVRRLEGAWSVLIGAPAGGERRTDVVTLPKGSTIVLYTDGLVESRESDVESGIVALEQAVARTCVPGADAKVIGDALVAALGAQERDDDTAVLVVRLLSPDDASDLHAAPASSRLVLPPAPASSALARRVVRAALRREPSVLQDEALLLVSELVSNAVTHGRGEVGLRVVVDDDRVRVEVDDADPAPPRRIAPVEEGPPLEGGRGVVILDALAARWGSEPFDAGKVVWFELDR